VASYNPFIINRIDSINNLSIFYNYLMVCISSLIKRLSIQADQKSKGLYWADQIKEFGIDISPDNDYTILRQIYYALSVMPVKLVKACGITEIFLKNLGPNRKYFPNHGYFYPEDKSITLNRDIFINPDVPEDFFDKNRYYLSRPIQTLTHEIGHSFDHALNDISKKSEWMSLSGWSFVPRKGLKRLIINEPGMPSVVGEMYYSPKAEFTRYYARRNSWDDLADSFAFYVGNLKDKVPADKRAYLDTLLKKYY